MRKTAAILSIAIILLTALVPSVVFLTTPLIEIDAVIASGDLASARWQPPTSSLQLSLLALSSSRHLPRASLLPACS